MEDSRGGADTKHERNGIPRLTVVIPVHNEAGNIERLIGEIEVALRPLGSFEILCVDDASDDGTAAALLAAKRSRPSLRVARHQERAGQSAALRTGVKLAKAEWVVTLDGDGQNDPADIPALIAERDAAAKTAGLMIAGVRRNRRDSLAKRLASRLANSVRRSILKDAATDTGCGLKLFERRVFLDLPFFDHMHRFLPALINSYGGQVREVDVNHRPRGSGRSHYGILDRGLVGVIDLFGVAWLRRRQTNPVVIDEDEEWT